jgi:hypothetical protein
MKVKVDMKQWMPQITLDRNNGIHCGQRFQRFNIKRFLVKWYSSDNDILTGKNLQNLLGTLFGVLIVRQNTKG